MENIITPGLALKAAVPGDDRRGGALTTNNTVSETNKFGVDAVELNPNIEGSMAHDIVELTTDVSEVNSNLANLQFRTVVDDVETGAYHGEYKEVGKAEWLPFSNPKILVNRVSGAYATSYTDSITLVAEKKSKLIITTFGNSWDNTSRASSTVKKNNINIDYIPDSSSLDTYGSTFTYIVDVELNDSIFISVTGYDISQHTFTHITVISC